MRKMAVGPKARGSIDLKKPVAENISAIADAFGRMVNDVTTIVLDRPRHHDLIEEIRAAGARIKLIQAGDVTASISAAIRGTNPHLRSDADRPRPSSPPRPDRGDPRRGRSDQTDPGRRRDRVDLRCDPRHQRPP